MTAARGKAITVLNPVKPPVITPPAASLGSNSAAPGGGSSGGSGTPAASPTADPAQLLKEWAACMRR